MNAPRTPAADPLHQPAPHESAHLHVRGSALYVDDLPDPPGCLIARAVTSPLAHGRLRGLDLRAARATPGVVRVLTAADIPGHNAIGPVVQDEPALAADTLSFVGQPFALILATSLEAADAAAALVVAEIDPLPAILSIAEALDAGSFLTAPHTICRGAPGAAIDEAPLRVAGSLATGGQDHFYLETQAALVLPEESGSFRVLSSTQHPSEVQREVASVLGLPSAMVSCEVPRLGGGFGGKESQASGTACLAALGAWATGRPVRMRLRRGEDMRQTGKRHPFWARYRAGFSTDGELLGLEVELWSDGGATLDLSGAVMDRALFHIDNACFGPALRFVGQVCKTHLPSNTAFRGFGGPQGVAVMQAVLDHAAEVHGFEPLALLRRNLYGGPGRDRAPYGQQVQNNHLHTIIDKLATDADYAGRCAAAAAFNAQSPHRKRGVALHPVKFGISFTKSFLNQAGALVLLYTDGSAQLNHGGTEMGQGLHTKLAAVLAHELGLDPAAVRVMRTSTEKVPNTSPTAASSGTDLNGAAVQDACQTLRSRLTPLAATLLGCPVERVRYGGGGVFDAETGARVTHKALFSKAWIERISLAATGYYATPGIAYDADQGQGTPFYYYAYGAAIAEVELCGLTGEHRLRRVDILHDAGNPLVPTIDVGQVEGAFAQGLGWLTTEELRWDGAGRLLTAGPSTYKIPTAGDLPLALHVALLEGAENPGVVGGSKAVGEPPFMHALAVVSALRRAVAAFGNPGEQVHLRLPATGEALLDAVDAARGGPLL
jgi:xanthine dehydrogenase large subunit